MNSVAFYIGRTVIYWNGIVIVLGILAGFFLSYALYTAHSGRGTAMWAFLPLATVFSIVFCRALHYFSFPTQYPGFFSSIVNYSSGSFCLPAAILGIWLAAFLVKVIGFAESTGSILDAVAPGAMFSFAIIRLSALFNNTLRGKIVITDSTFQRLPFAAEIVDASGHSTYRLASFFISFILLIIMSMTAISLYYHNHGKRMKRPCRKTGNIARLSLVLWAVTEIICDSTRFDAPHLKFGSGTAIGRLLTKAAGFVGINMVIAAVSILCVFIYYSKNSVRSDKIRTKHWFMWVGFFLCLAMVGGSEYLYQRFAFKWLYLTMITGLIGWVVTVFSMYKTCRLEK